jgi:hypothetical protein
MVPIAGSRMPTKLPTEDHVLRYVRKNRLRRDDSGKVIGVLPQAFERRETETYLSVTWMEHFCSEYEAGLRAAAAAIRRQLDVKPHDGFTAGNVGKIIECWREGAAFARGGRRKHRAFCYTRYTTRSFRAV